jgi:hypothetical protein
MIHNSNSNPKVLFFLGAGASVPAGINGVIALVHEFKHSLQLDRKLEDLKVINSIIDLLRRWKKYKLQDYSDIDIELLLQTIEKLEDSEEEVLLEFYDNKLSILPEHIHNKHLSGEVKRFIRKNCFIPMERIDYLKRLLDFREDSKPLRIFSTNYDNSIEQFCEKKKIMCVDGFDSEGWNPRTLQELKDGIGLYKIHGSITWWRTERGDYKSLPIKTYEAITTLSSGEPSVPFIVYPGRKLEYSEPVNDLLVELKKYLRNVNYVFVIGYSFKDDHIVRLFRYAARRNSELVLFVISPEAHKIYDTMLKKHKDREFPHSLTDRSFTSESFSKDIDTDLLGRVIPLPYRFEKVIPLLKKIYLDNLERGQILENQLNEKTDEEQLNWKEWKECLACFLNCEFMEKVEEIIKKVGWNILVTEDWEFAFELNIKGLLNALSLNQEDFKEIWRTYFLEVSKGFSVEKFVYHPNLPGPGSVVPAYIQLELLRSPGNINPYHLAEYLQNHIIPIIEGKLRLVSGNKFVKIGEFLERIRNLNSYLRLWRGYDMTYDAYYRNREMLYPTEIRQLRELVKRYLERQNENMQHPIRNIIQGIERRELYKIYGGDLMRDDLSLVRLAGYLSKHH